MAQLTGLDSELPEPEPDVQFQEELEVPTPEQIAEQDLLAAVLASLSSTKEGETENGR